MGDQSLDRHLAVADRATALDRSPRGWRCGSRARSFPCGGNPDPEGDRLLDHADKHVAAAMGDEVEAPLHRPALPVASNTTSKPSPVSARRSLAARQRGADGGDRPRPLRHRFGSRSNTTTSAPGEPREQRSAEADRAGSDDEHSIAVRHRRRGGPHGRRSRETLPPHIRRALRPGARMRLAWRQRQQPGHAAVLVNAEHRDLDAAIRLAVAAGDALAAGKIGIDDADLAGREAGAVRRPRRPRRRARGP